MTSGDRPGVTLRMGGGMQGWQDGGVTAIIASLGVRHAISACVLVLATVAHAQPQSGQPEQAVQSVTPVQVQGNGVAQTDGVALIESSRRAIAATADWMARGVDSWFGDRPFDQGGAVTDGRVRLGLLHRQDQHLDTSLRFNANFRLPNLERAKAYALVGRGNEREVVSDQPGALSRQQRLAAETAEQLSFFAGLGLSWLDVFDFRIGLRSGFEAYAQARYADAWDVGDAARVDFRQTFFWSSDERLGSTTVLAAEHAWSPQVHARWITAATITQRSALEWSSVAGLYQAMGSQRQLALEALMLGGRHTGVKVSDMGLRVRWEQPVYQDWLVGDLIVGHFWPRSNAATPRGRAWALGGGLTLKF